jgi:hypothetical protein
MREGWTMLMNKTGSWLGTLRLIAAMAALVVVVSLNSPTDLSAASRLAASGILNTCPGICNQGICGYTSGEHQYALVEPGFEGVEEYDGGPHDVCVIKYCKFWNPDDGKHPICQVGFEESPEVGALVAAAETGNAHQLFEFIEKNKQIELNLERSSIQIVSCDRYLGNLPLDPAVTSELAQRLEKAGLNR